MELIQEEAYTVEDIYALPEGRRAELIDGRIYDMAPPSTMHQRILMNLSAEIRDYIRRNRGSCEVFPVPFAVFLYADDRNYVEPDISVICDKNKIDDRGCNGAPDWVIEIAPPSNAHMDYVIKTFKYRDANVREYWIVNPRNKTVLVYDFEKRKKTQEYSFSEDVPACIYEDFTLNIEKMLEEANQ